MNSGWISFRAMGWIRFRAMLTGMSLYSKRLEKGVFRLPAVRPGETSVAMAASDLAMLLDGIDWTRARRQKLHEPPKPLTNLSPQKIDKSSKV